MNRRRPPQPYYDPAAPEFLANETPELRQAVREELALRTAFSPTEGRLADREVLPAPAYPREVYHLLESFQRAIATWTLDVAAKDPTRLAFEGGEPTLEDIRLVQFWLSGLGGGQWPPFEGGTLRTFGAVKKVNDEVQAWAAGNVARSGIAGTIYHLYALLEKHHESSNTSAAPVAKRSAYTATCL